MKVLMPIPSRGFDPTEAAVSWKILRDAGHTVTFATPDGAPGAADPLMLSGEGLDVWGFLPLLRKIRLVGLTLRADARGRAAYAQMIAAPEFRAPRKHVEVRAVEFDGLLLPGGHAKDMRPYLESRPLQQLVADFFESGKPVAAVCHGVVLAARSHSRLTGMSVLHGRKTTALTWALEKTAAGLGRVIRFWDATYYRTYPDPEGQPGYMSVQAEVTRALASPADFLDAPKDFRKASGLFRDSAENAAPAFVVRDGNYLSARWPGDVHTFAKTFSGMLNEKAQARGAA